MTELSSSEIEELRELLEKEKIRKLKQLYSHLMDSNQIDALADLFTEDAICEFGRPLGPRSAVEEAESVVLSVQQRAVVDSHPLDGTAAAAHDLVDHSSARHAIRGTISGPLVLRAGPGAGRCY